MISLIAAAAMAASPPIMRMPDIHGDQIVFTSEGDLWLGSLTTGKAQRITSDEGIERNASFSPDGSQIAFEGEYDGRQAYVMPVAGGSPKRLTYTEGFRAVAGWTPDGKEVLFRRFSVPTNYEYDLVPATGGAVTRIPLEFASHVWLGRSSDEYCYTRFNRWYSSWFRYIGGMQNQIWVHRDGKHRQITNTPGTNEFPVWAGDRIYFVNENQARFTLMSVPAAGGQARAELPASDMEIRELSTDGARIIYEKGLDCEVYDPQAKKETPVAMEMTTDSIHTRPCQVSARQFMAGGSATPSGKRAFVESRGQILSLPFGEGEARVWKAKPGVRYRRPTVSPDGRKVAYLSDEGGESELYVSDVSGKGEVKLTKGEPRQIVSIDWSPDSKLVAFNDSAMTLNLAGADGSNPRRVARTSGTWDGVPHSWSPDSRWIAYVTAAPVTFFGIISIYDVTSGESRRVSTGYTNDSAPAFSSDGKRLAFLSARSFKSSSDPFLNQLNLAPGQVPCLLNLREDGEDPLAPKDSSEPAAEEPKKEEPKKEEAKTEEKKDDKAVKIDWEGLYDRRIELPISPGGYGQIEVVGDRVILGGGGNIVLFDLKEKKADSLPVGGGFALTSDKSGLVVMNDGLPTILDLGSRKMTPVSFGGLRLNIEPVSEWRQIYWDAWRLTRDYFYSANMHGVDWKGVGDKYAALLPRVKSRSDLDELIRWTQSELGSSHQYLSSGDLQDIKPRVPGAYLGVDIAADPSGRYRITRLFRGDGFTNSEKSPLLVLGKKVKEGMFLLAINGQEIRVGEDPWASLAGRAGQTVSVTLGEKPQMEGSFSCLVKPIPSEYDLRYYDWVQKNRDYVTKASNGRLGYLHLAAMGDGDFEHFVRQYLPQRGKEGFVIDGRFNNGGYVQDYINRILNASLDGFFNMRNSEYSWTRQGDYYEGPMALLINEFDISCGEEFPHRFRSLHRGVLIGRRTMGGEVGSSPGWPLIDGGVINVPNYGMWTPDKGWAIEGRGVEPDIDVPSDPAAFAEGRDVQIDRAVDWLLNELKKKPTRQYSQPPERDRVKNPG